MLETDRGEATMIGKVGFKCPCGGSFVCDSGPHDEPHCDTCGARMMDENAVTPGNRNLADRKPQNPPRMTVKGHMAENQKFSPQFARILRQ